MLFSLRLLPNLVSPHYWKKMWTEIKLVWRLMKDKRVPFYLKAIPLIVALYLLMPFDLIPGFIPIIGQLDDLSILLLGLSAFVRLAPADVVDEYTPEDVNIN
jgi:uncharacterized membrane protein YkvA (DUF1232 family)